ncbi:MFS transporter [Ketogulonicigenium robustum]
MGATMASPLFPLYEAGWGLLHAQTTLIYVIYMLGVLASFLFFARLSDSIGAVTVLRLASGLMLLGLIASAGAALLPVGGLWVLFTGRFLIGVASGMISTAAAMGMAQLEPQGIRHAPFVTSVTTMAGFGLGPLVCGLIAQFAPWPLITPYVVVLVPVMAILAGLLRLKPPARPRRPVSLLPQLGWPAQSGLLLVGSFAVFAAYALFSLLASLAPSFLGDVLPWRGPGVSGTVVGSVLFLSAGVQIIARKLPTGRTLPLALGLMGCGALLLIPSMLFNAAAAFLLADVLIGLGHGLSFMSGIRIVHAMTGDEDRAGVLASFLSISYLGAIFPTLAVGYLADISGLGTAVISFGAAAALLCVALALLQRRLR